MRAGEENKRRKRKSPISNKQKQLETDGRLPFQNTKILQTPPNRTKTLHKLHKRRRATVTISEEGLKDLEAIEKAYKNQIHLN